MTQGERPNAGMARPQARGRLARTRSGQVARDPVQPGQEAFLAPTSLGFNHAMAKGRWGFSLVELLVVIAIVALLASFIVPAMSSVLQGNQLSKAASQVQQNLVTARQTAQTRNRRVEVRFYSFISPDVPGGSNAFQAMQSFLIEEDGSYTPLSKVAKLPGTMLINESSTLSPLIADRPNKTWTPGTDPQIPVPGVGTSYTAKGIEFRPDGGTLLASSSQWFLTIHAARLGKSTTTPPPNFITIQIDPLAGSLRTYQP